jgi:TolB-like protein/Flp pilus assembly protein TadD
MRRLFAEILRRNIHRAAIAYFAGAWFIVEVSETLLPLFGVADGAVRILVIVLAIGFLPAMGLAWAFEWSSGGIRTQADIDRDPHAVPSDSRRTDRVIIAILSIALLIFAIEKFVFDDTATSIAIIDDVRTIAVLPFDDLTQSQDHAYFADGLAEELLNLLAQNRGLKVAARTSSFRFRDSELDVTAIGEQLNVHHILEGSIRRQDDQIRVTAQLINAADGYHVWSATYDEAMDDIFRIQNRISEQIADALQVAMLEGDAPKARTTSPEAFERFLRGRYLAQQGTADFMQQARQLFIEVLAIDPRYSPAWSNLATVYTNLAAHGLIDYDEGYQLAREAAVRSTEVAPDDSGGYYQLSWIAQWYDGDLATAIEYMKQGLAIDPTDPAMLGNAAVLLLHIGKIEQSIDVLEYSVSRSPVEPTAHHNLGLAYQYVDRLADAEERFRKVIQLSPEYNGAYEQLGLTLLLMGREEEALKAYEQEIDDAARMKGLALANFALGNRAAADAALQNLINDWGDQWPSEIVHVYAYRGEIDNAFEWLEKEYEKYGAAGWGEWRRQRLFDNLHGDPRWESFLEKVGTSDAQLAAYDFNVEVPQ